MLRCATNTTEPFLLIPKRVQKVCLIAAALTLLAACEAPFTQTEQAGTSSSATMPARASSTPTASASPAPTNTPVPTTEPPAHFDSDVLRSNVQPVSYLGDACQYLADRWNPEGSLPGTVVAPIMFHSIVPTGDTPSDASHIDYATFEAIIALAENLGFETITSQELLGFLQENQAIPPRSMILILDDRRPGTADQYFLPYNEANDWTTTLAWPIGNTDQRPGLWEEIEGIVATGYFDVQSHGLNHIYLNDNMSEETVREEIEGSIPILEEHFGTTPIAYIWPGGNYTDLGIQVAHEAGFELGFTVRSRGPLQFNWIPQGEEELVYADPLLLLPRFWSSAALLNLQQTADIGDAAQAFAQANYANEAGWYSQNCGGELPPLVDFFSQP